MRLHCGQKCSSTGAPAPQLRHSRVATGCAGIGSEVIVVGSRRYAVSRLRPTAYCQLHASSSERAAATAGLLRVRVVEHEALCQERGVVVERRPLQNQVALLIHEDLRAVPLEHFVTEPWLPLPGERIAQPGAASTL